ncbi:MAG TPA: PH domain-containing protein, partial [Solirubrobacteraceae bacterium]|nr:PH domain-containing protein [Solirubrobacteraceae bacterium]
MSGDEAEHFRSVPHILVQVVVSAVVVGISWLFGVLALGGTGGLVLAAVLTALVAHGFYRAARVAVDTRPEGVRVVNARSSVDVPWEDIVRFTFVHNAPSGNPQAFLVRSGGERVPVDVLNGPRVTTKSHRRWAAEAVEELNRRVERHRVSGR